MRTRILLTIAATATILAGCSNEETNEVIDSWDGEIRLSSGLAVQTRANTPSDQGTQIASEQEVGVFINAAASPYTAVYANLKYEADGNGALTLATTDPTQTTPYYPNGKAVKIVAYQPYDGNAANAFINSGGDTYDFSVKADQNGNSNGDYYDSDLLYATIGNAAAQKDAHKLTFTHKLSKILCTLAAGDGANLDDLSNVTVSIVGAKIKGTFKPTDGTFTTTTGTGSGNESDVKLNSAITQGSYIGIIPPQEFAQSAKFIEVAIGSSKFYYTPTSAITLTAAKVHKYKITVKPTGLTVTSEITDWTGKDDSETPGDATMDEPTTGSEGAAGGA